MGSAVSTSACGSDAKFQNFYQLDFYKLLEVEEDAGEEEIKKAYRRKALEHHPDKNSGDVEGATKRFARIREAVEVLSDSLKRREYDLERHLEAQSTAYKSRYSSSNTWYQSFSSWIYGLSPFVLQPEPKDPYVRFVAKDYIYRNSYSVRQPGISAKDIHDYFLIVPGSGTWDKDGKSKNLYTLLQNLFQCIAFDEKQWGCAEDIPEFGSQNSAWSRQDDLWGKADGYAQDFYEYWREFETRKSFDWVAPYKAGTGMSDKQAREVNEYMQTLAMQEYNHIVTGIVNALAEFDPRLAYHKLRRSEGDLLYEYPSLGSLEAARLDHQARMQQPYRHRREDPSPPCDAHFEAGPKKQSKSQKKKQRRNQKAKQKKKW